MADAAFAPLGRSCDSVLDAYRRGGSADTEEGARTRFLTDTMFRIPAIRLADAARPHGSRAYAYVLS